MPGAVIVILGGLLAAMSYSSPARANEASVSAAVKDEAGILVHTVQSEYQSAKTKIRVLLPRPLEKGKRYPVLYVLPVEPTDGVQWGDGLGEVRKTDLHNKYGMICVQPTFLQTPWFADHPTNPKIRQETYFLKVVVPFIDRIYPTLAGKEGRLVLGFSKSGCGAFSLLLRHPEVFGKAAVWDAPLMMERPDKYGMADIFGTQENFEQYRIAALLRKEAAKLGEPVRLMQFGYGNFREHHQSAHRLMDELKITHQYRDGPKREHSWHSGWLPEVVQMLAEPAERSVQERIEARRFPSVFQAWNPAQNVHDESPLHTVARHDLVWHAPEFFGLRWNNKHVGLADGFVQNSVENARTFRQKLLGLNPNLILIVEIRYRDAHKSYLPEEHSWWLRDKQGRIVPGWEEGGYLCLDFHNPEFRRQVAKHAEAAVTSGAVDGVMLDWWSDDADRLALVKEVREAIGDHALIICNANDRATPQTVQYINGYFMECYRSKTAEDWKRIADTLAWAEKNLRSPRVNCLETWFHKSRDDLNLMRAITALALTLSNGYCLFSDPNPLPTPDHLHNWYPFWNKSLGRPVSEAAAAADGTVRRDFDAGTVIYNPMGNRNVAVVFSQPRTSVATGRTAKEHHLANPDGDIYLVPRPPFILGADISWVQQQEDEGVRFSDHGKQKDILAILKDHGFNWIRLRIFHNPKAEKGYSKKGYGDLGHTLAMAKRIKAAGMRLLLDFHYSDTWADPGHQIMPAAWVDFHGAELEKTVHDYTRDVVAALKQQGTAPDIVQIGNEISNGFLWPDGNVWKSGKWDVFCGLIKAEIAGAKEADPSVKTMIHLAWGGQNAQSRSFLDKAFAQGVEFDIIGQSYYSKWHGTLDDLKANLTDLAGRYKQDIIVVEYSVPNMRQINDIVHGLPGGKGLGTFIWEPTKWEGPALFDGKGNTKPEIDVYPRMTEDYGKGDAEPCSPFHSLALISTDCRQETCWKITCRNNSRKSENDTCHAPTA
jgi:arabinogalactan endo-1,4-beta-galactosidase